ncbi:MULTISPECIES: phosphoadenylyl-sulfate reductase [unclassified Oceanobacter]|jgi:phosphoadenosine phosphosulfate reductase|uniref:phosphoadenylyl-sulfate reductase n=1 Tax=unclassified Oceanobacter TaxID=2620260 RepID=UPI0026E457CA|nr:MULTISPECIES: phosphoadenylyl-sulfate reductase [unclassified Oceanobacter]MDO6681019.1 phosphoadenylyl-sulfate reductase [Oceanobacter sp. 5_MG-2023]MDP2504409.1 phosphoadenylyl-sulfate reductase [Oceanobacter sp. 3_MG-2023]MDP2548305.1 phosphoadenylyl-sulfate reductase [Oceanobacter sp. 4_MG-2023]MDP2608680.1 phosphoadenylyl-sulfate reductase [Oceanobacter sp. 1_MG-2023]MDP2611776.1 phosphoadenylyl-sulfate reductase [Oceanobacter sp. 2_MG-2023]
MTDFTQLNAEYASQRPKDLIRYALEQHDAIAVSFSGAEDVVLIDMAVKLRRDVQVFTLDTGRLHPETYEFIEAVRKHYGIKIQVQTPDQQALQEFTSDKGMFSFFEDGHKECCGIRKIQPLKNKLATLDAWITGQRRDQSPGTRSNIEMIEVDASPGRQGELIKYNPLTHWTSAQVWEYIKMFDVPYNPLHSRGFVSIGCQPCTRPVLPNQHEREGRWWWEEETHKECGLHSANIISKG